MKKARILLVSLAVFSTCAFAQGSDAKDSKKSEEVPVVSINIKGLTDEQAASVRAQALALTSAVEQMKKTPKENTLANLTLANVTPDKFKEWADAGQAAGKAVANFTKEVGMGADAFLKTDTGKYAFIAIIWKAGGAKVAESATNIIIHVMMAIVLYTAWWWLTRLFVFGQVTKKEIVYNENTFLRWIGMNKKTVTIQRDAEWHKELKGDEVFWLLIWSRIISVALLILITWHVWPSASF